MVEVHSKNAHFNVKEEFVRQRRMSSLTLYHTQPTRSVKIFVLLEELGVAYSVKDINFRQKEHKTPEYLAVNPFGKIPALTDGDIVLFESSAIAYYLLDKYDVGRQLTPPPGTRENAVHHMVSWGRDFVLRTSQLFLFR